VSFGKELPSIVLVYKLVILFLVSGQNSNNENLPSWYPYLSPKSKHNIPLAVKLVSKDTNKVIVDNEKELADSIGLYNETIAPGLIKILRWYFRSRYFR